TLKTLAQLIHSDPVLASKIFALANSAAYSINTKDMSLLHIMQMLGFNIIRSTIYNYCLSQLFADRRFKRIDEAAQFVRNRSLEIAGLNYAIAKHCGMKDTSMGLLAGLFHNVGALAILNWLAQNPSVLTPKEQKALIVTGQHEFAAETIEDWRVPESMLRVILIGDKSITSNDDEDIFVHLVAISRWFSRVTRNSSNAGDAPTMSLKSLGTSEESILESRHDIMSDMVKVVQTLR
ncbi:MAG: HDOD domain-containing protein, partial [Kangiellaceae bacterium]|nr:HDOD domain-containing protein [Kangiellaceae bacterium]